ncbi:MAG: Holliday junction resolvase Hjc [Acidilobaceae archaeon]|nr:Holliday junction resolvase Hjc [Acidilobaceae archaeon]
MPSKRTSKMENELANYLWKKGYMAVRAAASGAGVRERFQPDIVAAKEGVLLIIEVKEVKSSMRPIYVRAEQVEGLRELARRTGGKVIFAVKIAGGEWRFHALEELKQLRSSYKLEKPDGGLKLRQLEEKLFKRSKKMSEFL